MCMRVPSSFQDHFASLSDQRSFRAPNLRHDLIDILSEVTGCWQPHAR